MSKLKVGDVVQVLDDDPFTLYDEELYLLCVVKDIYSDFIRYDVRVENGDNTSTLYRSLDLKKIGTLD